jgi:hypothetical protein
MNRRYLRPRIANNIDSFALKDEWSSINLQYRFSDRINLWTTPVYTLNESESGLGKTYQYLSLLIQKPLNIESGASCKLGITVMVE